MEIILNNPERDWNWFWISKNPSITWEQIHANPDKNWYWCNISSNLNITWEIIEANPGKMWNWQNISFNNMEKGKELWIGNLRLKLIKVLQIQRHWRNCISNPEYRLAQKLIKARLE